MAALMVSKIFGMFCLFLMSLEAQTIEGWYGPLFAPELEAARFKLEISSDRSPFPIFENEYGSLYSNASLKVTSLPPKQEYPAIYGLNLKTSKRFFAFRLDVKVVESPQELSYAYATIGFKVKGESNIREVAFDYYRINGWARVEILFDQGYEPDFNADTLFLFIFGNKGERTTEVWLDNLFIKEEQNSDWVLFHQMGSTVTTVLELETPTRFKLYQNYPNPFNPETAIKFDLKEDGYVVLEVFNPLGQLIQSVKGHRLAGEHSVTVADHGWSSGLLFYRLSVKGWSETKKMILLK